MCGLRTASNSRYCCVAIAINTVATGDARCSQSARLLPALYCECAYCTVATGALLWDNRYSRYLCSSRHYACECRSDDMATRSSISCAYWGQYPRFSTNYSTPRRVTHHITHRLALRSFIVTYVEGASQLAEDLRLGAKLLQRGCVPHMAVWLPRGVLLFLFLRFRQIVSY